LTESEFLVWMSEQGYTDVKIVNYKKNDHVWYVTPQGDKVQAMLQKGVKIETLEPRFYSDVAMSRDERLMFWFPAFWDISCGLATGQPFKPSTTVECSRCLTEITRYELAIPYTAQDDVGEEVNMILCWSCDHDVINGGDPFQEAWEIWDERREEEGWA